MKIVDKSLNEEILFEVLQTEDIFKYDDRLFMKVSNSFDGQFNAYDFSKSRLTTVSKDTTVKYVPSELILHERGWDQES